MSKSNDSMTAKRDNQNQININYKFLKYTFYSFIVAVVFSIVAIIVTQADFPKLDGQTLVGITTLLLTLPVTWAAAYVVIQLGVRMDALAHDAEAREIKQALDDRVAESYQSSRDAYVESFNHLKNIAQVLTDAHTKFSLSLIELSLNIDDISGWSNEDNENYISDNSVYSNASFQSVDHALDSISSSSAKADTVNNLIEAEVKRILKNKKDLLVKIDLLLNESWLLNYDCNDMSNFKLVPAFNDLYRNLESKNSVNQSNFDSAIAENNKKSVIELCKIDLDVGTRRSKTMLSFIEFLGNDNLKGIVRALANIKILLSNNQMTADDLIRNYVKGVIDRYLKEEYKPAEAATLFLGVSISPISENKIGKIALEDLLRVWPNKESLINQVINGQEGRVKVKVKNMLDETMPYPESLVVNLRKFMAHSS